MRFLTSPILFALIALVCSPVSAGCGDDASADGGTDSGGGDTDAADTGAMDTRAMGAGDSGATDGSADGGATDGSADGGATDGSADGGATDGSADGGATDGSADGGDAGSSAVTITELSAGAWANCMPIVPADPLRFALELRYDNTAGATAATATITSAKLTFDDAAATNTDVRFDVETVAIGAGVVVPQRHIKTTSTPIVSSCSICSSGRMVTYDLMIDIDGVSVPVSGTTSFICTF